MANHWRELFPSKLTLLIFFLYMSLFIGQGIFVTASQEKNNSYSYNTITVVLLTEVLKLIVSASLYCRDNNLRKLIHDVRKDYDVMLLYFVPALLYCLYNNLAFVNLSTFDPTTYYLLLQLRVVITGILFQIIFKKYLSKRQWISLILLTAGCMLKQINIDTPYSDANDDSEGAGIAGAEQMAFNNNNSRYMAENSFANRKNMNGFDLSFSAVLILAQTAFSCLAGVYNEYLLKDKGADVNIFVQNVFMYVDSIVCNAMILLIRGEIWTAFNAQEMNAIFRFQVFLIIINNAAIGIVTSFFLKYMNSILKTFASALELLFTAVLCYFLFGIPIYINTALSIGVVSIAIYLYTQSPVINVGKVRSHKNQKSDEKQCHGDMRKLLHTHLNDKDDPNDTQLEMDMV